MSSVSMTPPIQRTTNDSLRSFHSHILFFCRVNLNLYTIVSVMKLLGSASNHKDDGLDDPLARFTLILAAVVHDAGKLY